MAIREATFRIIRRAGPHADAARRQYPYYYKIDRSGKPVGEVWQGSAEIRKFYRDGRRAVQMEPVPDTLDAAGVVYYLILRVAFDVQTARDWAAKLSKNVRMPCGNVVHIKASELFEQILDLREREITSPATGRA